jgi:hypothetical protein
MKELNLPEKAPKEKMNKEDKERYNRKIMLQEEVSSYKEVEMEEEKHEIQRRNLNEILIEKKRSEFPLDPEADENNSGINQS